jgi:Zn-dependent alcohol dehydrogenases
MATIKDGKGTLALAAFDNDAVLSPHEFGRPPTGPNDVSIDIQFCGMCHSDCHACNGDWFINKHPMTPGHEIAGIVREVGSAVSKFKVGDRVGVGCMVESCGECDLCKEGLENHCLGMVQTYSSDFPAGRGENFKGAEGYHTNGGYSTDITVNQKFVFGIPENVGMEYAGVLFCAGITMFSPLNRHILQKGNGSGEGKKVGIVGFGGLGQMGVKLAKAMGCEVTVFSRSNSKQEDAKKLGADVLVHSDEEAVKAAFRQFDVVVDTVSAKHPVAPLVNTLKVGGVYVLIGGVVEPFEISSMQLLFNRQSIEGSLIGSLKETQEMLDFCAKHNIVPEYKVIDAKDANGQFQDLLSGKSDASRAVIDISTLKTLVESTSK